MPHTAEQILTHLHLGEFETAEQSVRERPRLAERQETPTCKRAFRLRMSSYGVSASEQRAFRDVQHVAHKLEYTPGIRDSVTVVGSGDSQRSGFHSRASSPHMALLMLEPMKPIRHFEPLAMGIVSMNLPSVVCTGSERGRTVSLLALGCT